MFLGNIFEQISLKKKEKSLLFRYIFITFCYFYTV